MNLYAYAQIEDLDKLAKDNGIVIPRLRGYTLMKYEEPVSKEEMNDMVKQISIEIVKEFCSTEPIFNPASPWHSYSKRVRKLWNYYLVKEYTEGNTSKYVDIRWDRIHGKKRKILKFEIKKRTKAIKKQFTTWNKYVGKNVLYIHSRMGGGNWEYFDAEEKAKIEQAPWYLDRVDDYFDNTYCDFYAKLNTDKV